ncbi:unnamed protein product [Penicillium roqueforti FM164]|uniref:Uncharacterized protein n=1 Tax=Penicillium roqueforti (strain FM164) TaxID=1365484 RepID=W6QIQ4_PENRF|nr:unnamed protein product [Penicillium roqueforti FM164]
MISRGLILSICYCPLKFTLEGRTFIRRITAGSALDGDRVIYQKAEELEDTYRRKHGLDDIDEDYDSEVSEPIRYSNQRRSKTRNHFEASESSDDGSDASIQSSHNHNRRYRSEPARGLASSTQGRNSTYKMRKDSATEIKELERRIRLLKMRSPIPTQETQESQRRRRRGDRGRIA